MKNPTFLDRIKKKTEQIEDNLKKDQPLNSIEELDDGNEYSQDKPTKSGDTERKNCKSTSLMDKNTVQELKTIKEIEVSNIDSRKAIESLEDIETSMICTEKSSMKEVNIDIINEINNSATSMELKSLKSAEPQTVMQKSAFYKTMTADQ